MHDLNTAARTDETAGSDSAAQSNDFEVNMIIKEFEDEFLLQVREQSERERARESKRGARESERAREQRARAREERERAREERERARESERARDRQTKYLNSSRHPQAAVRERALECVFLNGICHH